MELLRFLNKQLVFVQGPNHIFTPDNPNVTLVYTPPTLDTNPPVSCNFLLVPTTSKPPTIPNYDLIAKVVNPTNVLTFYAKSTLNFDINFEGELFSCLSMFNRMVSGIDIPVNRTDPCFTFISVLHKNQTDFHPISNWETYEAKAAYSVCYYPPSELKEKNKFSILVDNSEISYSFPHSVTLYKQKRTWHSKIALFTQIQQYKAIRNIPIVIISLALKPKRRIKLMDQLDSQKLRYDLAYGLDGKSVNLLPAPPVYKKPLIQVTTPDESYLYDPTVRPNRRVLSWGEIGCAVSHLRIYRKMSSEGILILEDDANFDNFSRFFEQMRNLPSLETFDLCWMQNEATWWPPVYDTPINEWFCRTIGSVNLTHAYLLTKRGRQNLAKWENMVRSEAYDDSSQLFLMLPSDDYLSHAVRANAITCIAPYLRCISTQHAESDIGSMGQSPQQVKNTYAAVTVKGFGDVWTGLGNQMFQYAVAKLFQLKTKSRLVLPQQNKCSLAFANLDFTPIENQTVTKWEPIKEQVEFEHISQLSDATFQLTNNVELEGYFQNKKYFESDQQFVKEMFRTFHPNIKAASEIVINNIKSKYPNRHLVAVHIRRRDFRGETSPFLYYLYTQTTLDQAMKTISCENPVWVYFSNDREDVEANFKLPQGEWIDISKSSLGPHKAGIVELCCMTMCDHFVLSASTFSWWGSFLSQNPTKQIVFPPFWFNPDRTDCVGKIVNL